MGSHIGLVLHNYRLTRVLGEGGFGVVYEAIHDQLGRRAAVKILHPEFARHGEIVGRFFGEAQAACAVGHRAIIDIQNVGRLDSGEPYLMMEFVPGRSLASVIENGPPLGTDALAAVFGPVAAALDRAHAKGIVHRDLKPDNIMLVEEDGAIVDVKLLDFGIAKLTEHGGQGVSTRAGSVMGTPNYMAPEQATDAKSVDARADVYSFAATIMAALTGRPPFMADTTTALLLKVVTEPAPRLRMSRPDLPAALDEALARCLEKSPAARPASVGAAWNEVAAAIGAPLSMPSTGGSGRATTGAPVASTGAHRTTLNGAAGAVSTVPPARSHRRWVLAAAVAGAFAAVAAVLAFAGGDAAQPGTAQPAATLPAAAPAPDTSPAPAEPGGRAEISPAPAEPIASSAAPSVAPSNTSPNALGDVQGPEPASRDDDDRRAPEPSRPGSSKSSRSRAAKSAGTTEPRRSRDKPSPVASPSAPAPPPAPEPQPPPAPRTEEACSEAAFARVYRRRDAAKADAQAALRHLDRCERQGALDARTVKKIRAALTRILLSG